MDPGTADDSFYALVGQSSPAVILTKLYPPAARQELLPRERLLGRLRDGASARLTLLAAPAGSGKTSLLARWYEAEHVERLFIWVSVDPGDDDPIVLWSHVLEGLRRANLSLSNPPSTALPGAAGITVALLPRLVNSLSGAGPVVLVFDDFHRLSPGPARDSVGWFLEHVPPNVQLVVTTRTEPPFPLASLRAHGELAELRGDDLRFTHEEAVELLNDRHGLDLSSEDVEVLMQRTEGWAAGMYLATFSLERSKDRHAFLLRFGATNRHVLDFLSDEVLASHEPEMLELMLGCSILERFNAPLCDFVLEREGSSDRLTELSRSNLFLVPLDEEMGWYRFHRLFAALLSVELERREPGGATRLHRRAFQWHLENGTLDEAIGHALDAEAFREAAELITRTWPLYANTFRYASAISWVRRLPEELRCNDVRVRLATAWLLSLSARRREAAAEIAAVERLAPGYEGALPDGFSSVESSLTLLRAIFPWGDTRLQLEHALRAAEMEGQSSPLRPVACWAVGWCLYFDGRFEEADRWLEEAAEKAPAEEQWRIAGSANAYRSLVAGERGLLDQQTLHAEQAEQLGREYGLNDIDGEIQMAVGISLVARGRPEEALPRLNAGVEALRTFGQPIYLAHALLKQASVLKSQGLRAEYDAAIAEARSLVDSYPDLAVLAPRLDELEGATRAAAVNDELTERELTVLRLMRGTLSERDIGRELYVSYNTIHSHVRSIYLKLGVSSRRDALAIARTRGLL